MRHFSYTRYNRRKCSYNRYKTCQYHGFAAMFFIECFGTSNMFMSKEQAVFLAKNSMPITFTNFVPYIIANNGRSHDNSHEP